MHYSHWLRACLCVFSNLVNNFAIARELQISTLVFVPFIFIHPGHYFTFFCPEKRVLYNKKKKTAGMEPGSLTSQANPGNHSTVSSML